MQNRQLKRFGIAVFALAGFFVASIASQSVFASEPEFSLELMPYEVLSGDTPPQFEGDPSAETRPVIVTSNPDLDGVKRLILDRRFDEALDRLDALGAAEETDPRVSYYRVLALCGTKRVSDAQAIRDRLAGERSTYGALMDYSLGCAYLNLSRLFDSSNPEKALACLSAAAEAYPGIGGLRFYSGLAYLELGQYEEAVAMLRESASTNRSFAEAHLNLGFALSRLGKRAEALDAFLTARELGLDDPQIHMAIGDALFDVGRYGDAAKSYEAASNGLDGFISARYKLSLALLMAGDPAQSQVIAEDLVSKYARHFDGHVVLGRARLALGDVQGAIQAFESALWLRPGHFNVRLDLAAAYLELLDPDKASSYIDEALDIYDGDARAYMLLARVREMNGDTVGARSAALKSVQIDPSSQSARELYERLK